MCQEFDRLLAQAERGDKAAQGELLDSLRGQLHGLTLRQMDGRLGKRLDPSDVVQDTIILALRDFNQVKGKSKAEFLAWLTTVHHNVVLNLGRRHRAKVRAIQREDPLPCQDLPHLAGNADSTPSRKVMKGELILKLASALETLPADQCEAVRMRYCDGLALVEIAVRMQRSTQSVAGLLKRGLQALRARLGSDLV